MWRQDLNQCQHYCCQHFCLQQCNTRSIRTTTVSTSVYSNVTHAVPELSLSALLSTAMQHTPCQNYRSQHFCLQQCNTCRVSALPQSALLYRATEHTQSVRSELPLSAFLSSAMGNKQECQNYFCNKVSSLD